MLLLQVAPNTPTADHAGAYVLGGLTVFGALVIAWMKQRAEGIDKPSLLYALVPVPVFALVTWLAISMRGDWLDAIDFLILQIAAFLLGILHCVLFYREVGGWRALAWPKRERPWSWPQFWFTMALVLCAMIGIMVVDFLGGLPPLSHGWNYFPALFTFLVPFLWIKAYDAYLNIPVAEFTPWYPPLDLFTYEQHEKFPKVTVKLMMEEDKTGRIDSVPFDPNVRFELVYRWILHTYLNTEPEMYYSERDGRTFVWGWHFHRQHRSWLRWRRRIDPALTVTRCRLKDGDVVIAMRDPRQEPLESVREAIVQRVAQQQRKL